jgi:hypothetical protein
MHLVMEKQFRVTLWFKKGELDAYQAEQALGAGDDLHPGAVDLLPVEDRYLDDGSITREDSAIFSIHTGSTQYVPKMPQYANDNDDMGAIVSDLKRGRRKVLAVIATAMAAVCVMLVVYAF